MPVEVSRAFFRAGGGGSWRSPWPKYAELRDHDPVHHGVPPDWSPEASAPCVRRPLTTPMEVAR